MRLEKLYRAAPDIAARALVTLGLLAIPVCAFLLTPDRLALVELAAR